MKIAVIKPSMLGKPSRAALTPLLFALLRPLTPPGIELLFYDENIEPLPQNGDFDAVALTADTFTVRRAYQIAREYRERGIPVILGGYHATTCPEEASAIVDTVVMGEAEDVWPQILNDLEAGALAPEYRSSNDCDLSDVKYDYSVFEGRPYNPLAVMQYTRGCRFNCDFCSVKTFYGTNIRLRPCKDVANTMSHLTGKLVFFADDNFCADKTRLSALLKAIAPLKKRWVCQVSMDIAMDQPLLRAMREAGCMMVLLGLETLHEGNLQLMGKHANLGADYLSALENIHAAGLMIYGCFVIGYDYDDAMSAERACDFALEHKFAIANFNPLIPTPATPLYERLKQEGRLLYDGRWWLDPKYRYGDTAFMPAQMSPEELAESVRAARLRFYSKTSTLKRLRGNNLASPANLLVHLVANTISRHEIHAKQYQRLGA